MKAKLLGFGVTLLAVATIGIVQLNSQALQPGQVNNTPVCVAKAVGDRSQAFKISGNTATVKFKVSGKNNCRVQLSSNSFYAPTMNGRPYEKQILFKRVTNIYKPGSYSMSVALPPKSTPKQGCFYQVDLTYGTHNIQPVLAYGHGKLNCNEPKPSASCENLSVSMIERTKFRFDATANVKNGAKVKGYVFTVSRAGQVVSTKTITSNKQAVSTNYSQPVAGKYTVRVTVKTSEGAKTGANCVKSFTVVPPETPQTPGVAIEKFVENIKYKRVGVNVEYSYQINVINTGNTDLKDVKVTDTPDAGITLVSASNGSVANNTWTYTIAELKKGETMSFTLKAKVPVYLAGKLTNTVCVDAPAVPGNPDDCDTADVDVPTPGTVQVCNPDTGEIITVDEKDAHKYVPVGSVECEDTPVTPEAPITPEALPETGPAEIVAQLIGATSLTGATTYYIASRRNLG